MKKSYLQPQSIETEIFIEGSILTTSLPAGKDPIDGPVGAPHKRGANPIWGEN